MYQYYLGVKGNTNTRKTCEPTVIETEISAIGEIRMWLDRYEIDLDVFIRTIHSTVKGFIVRICLEDTRIFKMLLDNGNEIFVELIDEETPKCRVIINEDVYEYSFEDNVKLLTIFQVIDGIKFGADISKRQILLGKDGIFLTIELEEYLDIFFETIKSFINQLENWTNIANIICWLRDLPIEMPSYNLVIVETGVDYIGINKIYVIHDRIFKYVHINELGEYQVDYDSTWEARHQGYMYKYNCYEKTLKIIVPEKNPIHVLIANQYLSSVQELISTMYNTLKYINGKFDEIDKKLAANARIFEETLSTKNE